jgi:hypothetical protein
MNQTILHRTAPRYSLLAAAVLSSLATADATPPKINLGEKLHADDAPSKKDLAIANFLITLRITGNKVAYDDSVKTTENALRAKMGAVKAGTIKKGLRGGLAVAHHHEQHSSAGVRNFGAFTVIH